MSYELHHTSCGCFNPRNGHASGHKKFRRQSYTPQQIHQRPKMSTAHLESLNHQSKRSQRMQLLRHIEIYEGCESGIHGGFHEVNEQSHS